MSVLKAIDFFCGSGGMTYGLSKSGIQILAGIDVNLDCKKTYELNNPGTKFIEANIHDLSENELITQTGIKKNDDCLIFIGCSPCQYWSKINTDKTKSAESKNLLKEFQRFVAYFKPGYVVIENVPGLYKKKNENVLSKFLNFLNEESYIYDNAIINAKYYGVPQNRMRYLLIASKVSKNIKLPEYENISDLTVKKFIGNKKIFPEIPQGHKDKTSFLHTSSALSKQNLKRINITPKNGGDRSSWKNRLELQINAYKGKDNFFKDVYGRMFWDKLAPTITTRFNSLSNGRFGHPEQNRAISLREGATLQTFPISYKFYGKNIASIARQIGNAVPPQLAKHIGLKIISEFKKSYVEVN